MSSGDVLAGLTKVASLFADELRNRVAEMNVPHEIADVIYIEQPKMIGQDRYAIEVKIPMKDGAEAAAAFEWGSGEHAERRGRGTYRIPAEGEGLSIAQEDWPDFEWPMKPGPKMIGFGSNTNFLLRYVDHPGVEKRPYIKPAIIAVMVEAQRILSRIIHTELSIIDGKGTEVIIVG